MSEIIGMSGFARSGKDTVADYLVEHFGYTKVSFAGPIREALYNLNPEMSDISGLKYSLQQAVNLFGWESLKNYFPSYRQLMQRMGTEVGREMFGENFWVEQAIKKSLQYDKVVFTDVRYPNEANAIKELGGKIYRVTRDGVGPANSHASEMGMDGYDVDVTIDNSGSLDDLARKIEGIFING